MPKENGGVEVVLPTRILTVHHNALIVVGQKERPIDGDFDRPYIELAIDDSLLEDKAGGGLL